MKVSIIIPTYKPHNYLWKCLDSIANQTMEKGEYEVVLVLNGCNEPYYSEIREWLKFNSEVQVTFIQTDIAGVSNARNLALDNAQGEYITFLDDDDYISPSYLEDLFRVSSKEVIGIARPIAFTDSVNESQPYRLTSLFDKLYPATNVPFLQFRRFFSGPWLKLFHSSIIGNRRFDTRFTVGEDGLFNFLISDRFHKCTLAKPSAIYYRRYRIGSLVSKRKDKKYMAKNNFKMMIEIQKMFFSSPKNYSFRLYVIQSLGCIKGIF